MFHTLVLVSFLAGLIPAAMLTLLYGIRSPWERSRAGRAVFYLLATTSASYGVSTVVTLFPHYFGPDGDGRWFRVLTRFVIAAVVWNLLRLFFRAQAEPGGEPMSDREILREIRFTQRMLRALGTHLEVDMSALRDQFEADETQLETDLGTLTAAVSGVVSLIQALPDSADSLSQSDLDRLKAQAGELETANGTLSAIVTPAAPTA
jgi:hypothetical protein